MMQWRKSVERGRNQAQAARKAEEKKEAILDAIEKLVVHAKVQKNLLAFLKKAPQRKIS